LFAVGAIVALTLVLALLFPFERLAESTSIATLAVFAMVNASLLRLRRRGYRTDGSHLRIPLWVPAFGLIACVAMIGASAVS
jgi:amino acid transporter